MKRILIDYKKLDHAVAARLIDAYPYGYGDDDIITIKKPNGEVLEVVEVRTEDTIYLVKISKSLSNFIAQGNTEIFSVCIIIKCHSACIFINCSRRYCCNS